MFKIFKHHFPNIIHAIAFCELHMDYEMMFRLSRMPPKEVMLIIKETCEECRDEKEPGKWNEILEELEHPEFIIYLKGKLGWL